MTKFMADDIITEQVLQEKYFSQFEVIDGLNQHPSGLPFEEWLKINELITHFAQPTETLYKFTRKQLNALLSATVDMFFEYRDAHDKAEIAAKWAAVNEMMEGLDADKELVAVGEQELNLQIHN